MAVKIIENKENGVKWEIFKKSANEYFYKYYEYFQSIGWRLTENSGIYTKDCLEYELDTAI